MQFGVGVGVLVPAIRVSVAVGVPVPGTSVGVGVHGPAVTVPDAMLVASDVMLGAAAGVPVLPVDGVPKVVEEGVWVCIADGLSVATLVVFGAPVKVLVPDAEGVFVPPGKVPLVGAKVGALAGVDVPAFGAQAAAAATSIRIAPTIRDFFITGFLLFYKPAYAYH